MILRTVTIGLVLLPSSTAFSGASYSALQKKNDALAQQLVTPEIKEAYQQDGVVRVTNALSQDWINRLQQACTLAEIQPGPHAEYLQAPTDTAKYFTDLELSNRLEIYKDFSSQGPCAAIAGHVMQCTEIRFLYDQLFLKPEGVSTPTPWHQDGSYWSVEGSHICSIFCALDEVTPEEGLWFVTNTRSWPFYNRRHFSNGTPYQESASDMPELPDIDALVVDTNDQHAFFQFHLNPGDVLVFNHRIVHGGPGNYGRALSTRWVGEGTAWATQRVVPTNRVGDAGTPLDQDDAFPLAWQRE